MDTHRLSEICKPSRHDQTIPYYRTVPYFIYLTIKNVFWFPVANSNGKSFHAHSEIKQGTGSWSSGISQSRWWLRAVNCLESFLSGRRSMAHKHWLLVCKPRPKTPHCSPLGNPVKWQVSMINWIWHGWAMKLHPTISCQMKSYHFIIFRFQFIYCTLHCIP